MLRHIFVGKKLPDATDAQVEQVIVKMQTIPQAVPDIPFESFSVERSLGLSGEPKGVVLIATFATEEAWQCYMHDERHLAFAGVLKGVIDLEDMTVTQTKITSVAA